MLPARAAALGLLVTAAGAQVPDVWSDVVGHVRDVDGRPIAGARVQVVVSSGRDGLLFRTSAESLLRRLALPPAVETNEDGTYVLPVLPEHREVSAIGLDWWLYVEKDGFQPWREHLPLGLYGYLGSAVTLWPTDPADLVTLFAEGLDIAAGVALQRERGEYLHVAFAVDGRARVLLPRVPCPLQPGIANTASLQWIDAATGARVRRPAHRVERPGAAAAPTPLTRADGKPVTRARALVWNGIDSRLVPVPDARVTPSERLLAVVADGCCLGTSLVLGPLPSVRATSVRVVDDQRQPVPHARALLLRCEDWRPTSTRLRGGSPGQRVLWRSTRRADAAGHLSLADVPDDVPAVLLVAAEGCTTTTVLDPRALPPGGEVALARRAVGALEVYVVDDAGAPLAGARLCLPDMAESPASDLGEDLLTDGEGRVRAKGLTPGSYPVFVLRRGHASCMVPTAITASATTHLSVVLERGTTSAWLTRSATDDEPQPFAELYCMRDPRLHAQAAILTNGTARTWQGVRSDASGRLVVPDARAFRFARNGTQLDGKPDENGGFATLRFPPVAPLLVVPGPGLELFLVACRGPRTGTSTVGGIDGALVFPTPGESCSVSLLPAGKATLAPEQITALPRDPATGLRRWRVELPRVIVELPADCAAPDRWWGASSADGTLTLAPEHAVVLRDAAGIWRVTDRDAGTLWFVHPKYEPVPVELTPGQRRGEEAIVLPARPASPVAIDAARGGVGVRELTITVRGDANQVPTLRYRSGLLVGRGILGSREQQSPVEMPALPAGVWQVRVEGKRITAQDGEHAFAWVHAFRTDGVTPIEVGPPGN